MKNILDQETSPYLRQHRHNPVHWQVWGEDALSLAQRLNRPILLSIGYAACHWCHVMAHESFEDPETAAVMNRHFVNIKVDREERPDIDHIYQNALAAMGEAGGWPLTMFLDPAGNPFWGGTYFPPYPAYGRPAFRDILLHIATLYRENPQAIDQNRRMLNEAIARLNTPKSARTMPRQDHLDQAAMTISRHMDDAHGGLQGAPKFPQIPVLDFLLSNSRHDSKAKARYEQQVLLSMEKICKGGIYDHIGGGFARYATDAIWLVPHFEKMLYDNALILDMLGRCHRLRPRPLFIRAIEKTITWLQREMMTDEGAFAASTDADSSEGEGSFYTWTPDEVLSVLGPETGRRFCSWFDISETGHWEGRSIPNLLSAAREMTDKEWPGIAAAKNALRLARNQRPQPPRDDKILSDWNAMTIASLARLSRQFQRPDWLDLAESVWKAVLTVNQRDGNLCHSSRHGIRNKAVFLDDYAHMIAAAITLYQTSGKSAYLDQAIAMQHRQDAMFWRENEGAYAMAEQQNLPVQPMHCQDGPVPAGNAVAMANLDLLWRLSGEVVFRHHRDRIQQCFLDQSRQNVIGSSGYLSACEQILHPIDITLKIADQAQTDSVLHLLFSHAPDKTAIKWQDAAAENEEDSPFSAMLCIGQTCTLPMNSPEQLKQKLEELNLHGTINPS